MAEAYSRRRTREMREQAVVIRVAHGDMDLLEAFPDEQPEVTVEQDEAPGERWWQFDGSTA
jgi:hypothetical protein